MTNDQRMRLGDIHSGNIDGRYEFSEYSDAIDEIFLRPSFVNEQIFDDHQKYFVHGMRGAGKTSILRWLHSRKLAKGHFSRFVLFKSGVTESERTEISKLSGYTLQDADSKKMEFSQDFKDAWYWFMFHQIGEMIIEKYQGLPGSGKFLALLGLTDQLTVEKTLGWMPRLRNSQVRVQGKIGNIEAEIKGDLVVGKDFTEVPLSTLNKSIKKSILQINIPNTIYLFVDELEIFKDSLEQLDRDRRFVRDIVFVISELNDFFATQQIPIVIVGAIRSEVLLTIGTAGQEIQRRVYDKGIFVHWDQYRNNFHHPIFDMIRNKLRYSERKFYGNRQLQLDPEEDIILKYFPAVVKGVSLESFLLDRSFYRPRDVVQRMQLAIESYPNESHFSELSLISTEQAYSSRLWEEVEYGLSAKYTEEEIKVVSGFFAGKPPYFILEEFSARMVQSSSRSAAAATFANKHSASDLLHDLFVLGAVGNQYFATDEGTFKNRWIHRGDKDLFLEEEMVLQRALWRRFGAADSYGPPKRKRKARLETKSANPRGNRPGDGQSPKKINRGGPRKGARVPNVGRKPR